MTTDPAVSDSPVVRRAGWFRLPSLLLGVAVGGVVVGGVWLSTALVGGGDPESFELRGLMQLNTGRYLQDYTPCSGTGGYSDIGPGTAVTVYGSSGTVLAAGQLRGGEMAQAVCAFTISVPNVPAGEKFYQVEVSHRGKIIVGEDDARNGNVQVSLGDGH